MGKYSKGDIAYFIGYSEQPEEPILLSGDRVEVIEVSEEEGSYAVIPIVAEGEDPREGDTAFDDELQTPAEYLGEDAVQDVSEPVDQEDVTAAQAAVARSDAAPLSEDVREHLEAQGVVELREGETLEVHHTSSVQSMLEEKDALSIAEELVRRSEETEFALGGILAHIQREGLHHSLGYGGKRGFEDYIEKHLGVKYRKARYLINIYEYFSALGVDESRLTAMGWSKAKELVGVATKEDFDEWAEIAENHTRVELIEQIKTRKVSAEDESSGTAVAKQVRMVFVLYDEAAELVQAALDAAKASDEGLTPGMALEKICTEWQLANEEGGLSLEGAISVLERRYGATIQVAGQEAHDLPGHEEAQVASA